MVQLWCVQYHLDTGPVAQHWSNGVWGTNCTIEYTNHSAPLAAFVVVTVAGEV